VGRCGTAFAYELYGIEPDVMTLAKGLGGGLPLAALLCTERLNVFEPGDQGGTFCGTPLMAAVGLAVVNEVCSDVFLANVWQRSEQLRDGLQALVRAHGLLGERGEGLLRALVLPCDRAPQIVAAAQALEPVGLLLNAPRPHLLRLMPALNISAAELDEGLALLHRALQDALD
jgi:acetylornithine/N-succinyldiaminopimelate aminotransferase